MTIDWENARTTIGMLGRVRCEPGWRLDWRDPGHLRDFDLWFVWAGEGRMQLKDGALSLNPGVCLWMRPGHTYVAQQNPANRLGVTFIHFDIECRGRRVKHLPAEVHEVADFPFFDAAARRVVELLHGGNRDDQTRRLEAESLLQGMLIGLDAGAEMKSGVLSPARMEHQRKIRRVAAEMQENCGEPVSVEELARRMGYSPVHFSRVFKEVTGVLPREFMIRARIARAKQLLRESSLAVGEIADALGYSDVFFFSRQFKSNVGKSPSEYRIKRGA